MKEIILNTRQLSDFELIINGSFSPLKGFMNKIDYERVVNDMYLSSGEFFPMPIVLCIKEAKSVELANEEKILLKTETNEILCEMIIDDIYRPDFEKESLQVFGSSISEINHPYIKILNEYMRTDMMYIGGSFSNISKDYIHHYDFGEYRLSPSQTKQWFIDNGWKNKNIIGFTCRNPLHKSHYHLMKYAMKQVPNSKLFLNPVVGITQNEDIDYITRVKCYKHILKYFESNSVKLNLLNLNQRMAGGRDALFMSLIRKNYGCTHFVIGRDFSGPSCKKLDGSSFYDPYEAQEMLKKYASIIGITPIFSKEIVYTVSRLTQKEEFLEIDKVDKDNMKIMNISGTMMREMLKNNKPIPEWFSFSEIIDELKLSIKQDGLCVYFVGLSASGKSTLANYLSAKIKEITHKKITILDGDIIRNNISKGLGFSQVDRSINVRRIGYVASEIVKHQGIVIVANIAPFENDRLYNRNMISQYGKYVEVFVNTPISICEMRDKKGLYEKARKNEIKEFTGISSPFEIPSISEIVLDGKENLECNLNIILDYLKPLVRI